MSARHGPEEYIDDAEPPLFRAVRSSALTTLLDQGAARAEAEQRRDEGIENASSHAHALSSTWNGNALKAVELYAQSHEFFLCEQVREFCPVPFGVTERAWGGVFRTAVARGFVIADGVARANSSNRSHKTRWRSLIYAGGAA